MRRDVPVLPKGFEPLKAFLDDLSLRVGVLENPKAPGLVYACAKADLPAAAPFIGCLVRVTDSNILAHSDGTNWISERTGAPV